MKELVLEFPPGVVVQPDGLTKRGREKWVGKVALNIAGEGFTVMLTVVKNDTPRRSPSGTFTKEELQRLLDNMK